MNLYPYKFTPIYKPKIWGGRNLHRLFGRALPPGEMIGESWELADLPEGVSVVASGPAAGASLTDLTRQLGADLLGDAKAMPDGRFPLLLKLLDANDILSLQVHPDEHAACEIGPPAAVKTECWYVIESRDGFIYKGVMPGVDPAQFRQALAGDEVKSLIRRIDVAEGDFHYLPAGTVHALGSGVVLAEVQTPSDTTYRVTDWGRGRDIQVDLSMRCIRFELGGDAVPGAHESTLLATEFFIVDKSHAQAGQARPLPSGRCAAMMVLTGSGCVVSDGCPAEVRFVPGDTLLVPASLKQAAVVADADAQWLEITLPG